jgi:hypothetical protein
MTKRITTSSIYESLASILLPEGILELFEVTQVSEEHTGIPDETGTEVRILHIYLDERDLRDKEWHDLQPNGFTESRSINDFPIRDRKVVLHVRRRRWLDADGTSVILNHESLTAEGTSYSKEFAVVLKKIFGYLPDTGPLSGAVL